MRNSVTIGPLPFYFGNVNVAMGLRGHHHTATLLLEYGYLDGDHGYPSFLATNDELRKKLELLTGARNTFRDATNEDVAQRLFTAFASFCPPAIASWGGRWWLQSLSMDVEGVQDDIGHDNGATRYTVSLDNAADRIIHP